MVQSTTQLEHYAALRELCASGASTAVCLRRETNGTAHDGWCSQHAITGTTATSAAYTKPVTVYNAGAGKDITQYIKTSRHVTTCAVNAAH
jgi:hypothetical protein